MLGEVSLTSFFQKKKNSLIFFSFLIPHLQPLLLQLSVQFNILFLYLIDVLATKVM